MATRARAVTGVLLGRTETARTKERRRLGRTLLRKTTEGRSQFPLQRRTPDVRTTFRAGAKRAATSGWLVLEAAVPWFLFLFLLLLPLAVIFGRTIWLGTTLAFFRLFTRLVKQTRSVLKR